MALLGLGVFESVTVAIVSIFDGGGDDDALAPRPKSTASMVVFWVGVFLAALAILLPVTLLPAIAAFLAALFLKLCNR